MIPDCSLAAECAFNLEVSVPTDIGMRGIGSSPSLELGTVATVEAEANC